VEPIWTERYIHDIWVRSLEANPENKANLVFLHGIPATSYIWYPIMSEIGGKYPSKAPDLPGLGRSDPINPPTLSSYHYFIDRYLQIFASESVVLVGHDLGALYALTYAAWRQRRLSGLILMDTTVFLHLDILASLGLLAWPIVGELYPHFISNPRYVSLLRKYIRSIYPVQTDELVIRDVISNYSRLLPWQHIVRSIRGIDPIRCLIARRLVSKLSLPVLILWAVDDPYFPATDAYKLKALFPNSKLKLIDEGGHFLMLSKSTEVADTISDFLQETDILN